MKCSAMYLADVISVSSFFSRLQAMRLSEHHRIIGIKVFKYPAPKKVFQEPITSGSSSSTTKTLGSGGKKIKVLTTLDTSGFATAEDSLDDPDAEAGPLPPAGSNFGGEGTNPSGTAGAKGAGQSSASSSLAQPHSDFLSSSSPALASSKHLFGKEDLAAGVVAGQKKKAQAIRYVQGKEAEARGVTLAKAASAKVSRKPGQAFREDAVEEDEDSYSSSSGESDGLSESDDDQSASASTVDVVQWSAGSRSTSSQPGGSGVGPGTKRGPSKLAQFSKQALVDLAPKKTESLFAAAKKVAGGGQSSEQEGADSQEGKDGAANSRAQCANPAECVVQ
jgi:hypothetical protein